VRRPLAVVTALVMASMVWGSARPVAACTCVTFTAQEYVNKSAVVLTGTLTKFELYSGPATFEREGDRYIDNSDRFGDSAHFEVQRYLKGSGPMDVVIGEDRACGYDMSEFIGAEYIVFIQVQDGRFMDSFCNGSGPIADAFRFTLAEVEAITGPGIAPDESLASALPPDRAAVPLLPVAVAATVGPLAFLAAAAFVWGRKGGAA